MCGVDPLVEPLQSCGPARSEPDDVPPPVSLVGYARDEAVGLEFVEDGVEVAAVDPEPASERGLARRPLLCQRGEDGEVLPARAYLRKGGADQAFGLARDLPGQPARQLL